MIRLQTRAKVLSAVFVTTVVLASGHAAAQTSTPATQVAAAFRFTCALATGGGVKCWGRNVEGELGDNTGADSPVPVDVAGLTSGVAAIAVGEGHACALTNGGGVKCWGSNFLGELGDNSGVQQRFAPVNVVGLTSGVAAIAAGGSHTCALTTNGGMKCWGWNVDGELGDGSILDSPFPVDVVGIGSGVVAIAAGAQHTCALTTGSGVKCWGRNVEGQLGDNTGTDNGSPVDVVGLGSGVSAISTGGFHTCALTIVGGVKCWGYNGDGELGDLSNSQRNAPVDVFGLTSGVAAITAGYDHTCALLTNGHMQCWGSNVYGQLGNNFPSNQVVPVDVVGLGNTVAGITAGERHTCALTAGGNVKCWGDGDSGDLGDGTGLPRTNPVGVSGLSGSGAAQLALGEFHTCALTNAGGVKCWGFNTDGELGNNSVAPSPAPVDVTGLTSGVSYIAGSKFHTCAVTTGGAAKCWGQNTSGSIGDGNQGNFYSVPTDVTGLSSGIASMTAGSNHTCALDTAGAAKCWGGNSLGVLGDGSYSQRLVPAIVLQGTNTYAAISAGDNVTCAAAFGGFVQCWGANNAGQLGNGTLNVPVKVNVPGNVPGQPDIVVMDAGGDHTCALIPGGGVRCWGANSEGQLGNGLLTPSASPVNVSGLSSGVAAIAAGTVHTCALTTAGGVKCWGNNFFGQLGDNSGTGRPLPVDVVGLASGVAGIEAGVGHTCAITTAGGVKCWGNNDNGQLGDNTPTTPRRTPVVALIGGQSIAFTPPAHLAPGVPVTLSATATSGLPVTFDTWTPGTCTISGNSVTAISPSLCGIRASQAGTAAISAAPQVLRLVQVSLTPTMLSATSRRLHGAAGMFDLPLSAVTTAPTTEPRQGPAQTIVFTFDRPINAATPTVTEGVATAAAPSFSGNDVIVGLTGVTDRQYVTITLTNVASTDGGTGGSGSVRVGYLLGDVNQSRVVTVGDLVLINTQLGLAVSPTNYLRDVSANGLMSVGDLVITNLNLGKGLPAP